MQEKLEKKIKKYKERKILHTQKIKLKSKKWYIYVLGMEKY